MKSKREIKRASLNFDELNELWIPYQKISDNVGIADSETIKRALADGIKYHEIKKVMELYGINIHDLATKLKDMG